MSPATEKLGMMAKMIEAGMNVARFNFSHGDHNEHSVRIKMVREAAVQVNKPVVILLDTKGPEMRLGNLYKVKLPLNNVVYPI
jgi:pyruvate kinase